MNTKHEMARHVAIQPQGQFFGVALVVVDGLVLGVQPDGLHHQIVNAHAIKVRCRP